MSRKQSAPTPPIFSFFCTKKFFFLSSSLISHHSKESIATRTFSRGVGCSLSSNIHSLTNKASIIFLPNLQLRIRKKYTVFQNGKELKVKVCQTSNLLADWYNIDLEKEKASLPFVPWLEKDYWKQNEYNLIIICSNDAAETQLFSQSLRCGSWNATDDSALHFMPNADCRFCPSPPVGIIVPSKLWYLFAKRNEQK